MPSLRRELRGLVADRLAYWALRLTIWACRLDPERVPAQSLAPRPPARPGGNLLDAQN